MTNHRLTPRRARITGQRAPGDQGRTLGCRTSMEPSVTCFPNGQGRNARSGHVFQFRPAPCGTDPKDDERFVPDVQEFERIRRMRKRRRTPHGRPRSCRLVRRGASVAHHRRGSPLAYAGRFARLRAGEMVKIGHAPYTLCVSFEATQ
jgi:hypothetical protein